VTGTEEMEEAAEGLLMSTTAYLIDTTIEQQRQTIEVLSNCLHQDLDLITLLKKTNRKLASYRNQHF
jgi:hypothetical protein